MKKCQLGKEGKRGYTEQRVCKGWEGEYGKILLVRGKEGVKYSV